MDSGKLFFLLVFFLTVFSCGLFAQSTVNFVHGYVRDGSNYQPVNHANVYISGTTIGTTTDDKGYYKILNIPQGKNSLVVSITGYEA